MKTARFIGHLWIICLFFAGQGFGEEQKDSAGKPEQNKEAHRPSHEMGMGKQREGGMMQEAMIGRIIKNPQIVKELGLSEEQLQKLKSSEEELRKQNDNLQQQLKEAGLEQARKMTDQGTVDEEAVFAAVEKAGRINTEMAKARVKHMLLVKKTLTPEQTTKIREMMQRHIKQIRAEAEKKGGEGKETGEISKERREHIKKRLEENRKNGSNSDSVKPAGDPEGSEKKAE